MFEFGMTLAALFSGVFGAVIGFVIIGATALLLALPYVLLTHHSQDPDDGHDPRTDRYDGREPLTDR